MSNTDNTYKFKVESFRKLSLENNQKSYNSYHVLCDVKQLPIDIPIDFTNPREQNLNHTVAQKIKKSFLTNPDFWLLNRGIVFSTDTVSFDNASSMMTLTLSNLEKHGNIDGGHTYTIINQFKDQLGNDGNVDKQYVKLEILTGVEDFFDDLAEARNTSRQVDLKSLAELRNKFDPIKIGIKDQPFANDIAYKEFEDKKIDIREVVAILTLFNTDRYGANNHPVVAYSGKQQCIKYFLEDIEKPENAFNKLQRIAPDIFKLYSYIEAKMPEIYQEENGKNTGKSSKYGRIKGVIAKDKKFKSKFNPSVELSYDSPTGFIYPILAALRALIEIDPKTGFYIWAQNPFSAFDKLGPQLVLSTIERSRTSGNNPQSVGKDSAHWDLLYSKVKNLWLEQKLAKLNAAA